MQSAYLEIYCCEWKRLKCLRGKAASYANPSPPRIAHREMQIELSEVLIGSGTVLWLDLHIGSEHGRPYPRLSDRIAFSCI